MMIIKQIKGVALLWSLVLITVLLIVTGSMTSIIIKESQMTVNNSDSTQAYSNAKSGVDWAEDYLDNTGTPVVGTYAFDLDPAGTVSVEITGSSFPYTITSTGLYAGMTREIQVNYNTRSVGSNITGANPTITSNPGSFELNFDFWLQATPTATRELGLKSGSTNAIALQLKSDTTATLRYGTSAQTQQILQPDGTAPTFSGPSSQPYLYHAYIRYISNVNVLIRISQRNAVGVLVCQGQLVVPAPAGGFNLGDLSQLDLPSGSYIASGSAEGDGELYTNGEVRYDNLYLSH